MNQLQNGMRRANWVIIGVVWGFGIKTSKVDEFQFQ